MLSLIELPSSQNKQITYYSKLITFNTFNVPLAFCLEERPNVEAWVHNTCVIQIHVLHSSAETSDGFWVGQCRPDGGSEKEEMRGGVRGRREDCRVAKKRFQALITLSNGFPTTCLGLRASTVLMLLQWGITNSHLSHFLMHFLLVLVFCLFSYLNQNVIVPPPLFSLLFGERKIISKIVLASK